MMNTSHRSSSASALSLRVLKWSSPFDVPTDNRPAAIVGQRRSNDGREHRLLQEGIFVERDAVEVHAAHPLVGRHAAVELDDRAVVGEDDGQLAFEEAHALDGRGVLLQVAPDQILGLLERRADVAVARRRPLPAVQVRRPDQMIGDSDRLARAAVAAGEDPAFLARVQLEEVVSGTVRDYQR